MVAHPRPDVRTPTLSCDSVAPSELMRATRGTCRCPAGTGRHQLAAALCAEYVLKFASHDSTVAVVPQAALIGSAPGAHVVRYCCRGTKPA